METVKQNLPSNHLKKNVYKGTLSNFKTDSENKNQKHTLTKIKSTMTKKSAADFEKMKS